MKYELVGVRNGVELYNPVAENAAEERAYEEKSVNNNLL